MREVSPRGEARAVLHFKLIRATGQWMDGRNARGIHNVAAVNPQKLLRVEALFDSAHRLV